MSTTGEQCASIEEIYRPLDVSKNEIRLLSFDNSYVDKPLIVNLHYVSLNDRHPKYVASDPTSYRSKFKWGKYICLSYAWGDCEGEKVTIFINGVATLVTPRLALALQDMKNCNGCREKEGVKLWVDALCINQADVNERNSHVLRMKEIFGLAKEVVAWIKDDVELQDLEVGYFEEHPPGRNIEDCANFLYNDGREVLEEILGVRAREWGINKEQDKKLLHDASWMDGSMFDFHYPAGKVHMRDLLQSELWTMFSKEYWSRPWIIQEIAANPEDTEVHWGNWGGPTYRLWTLEIMADILLEYAAAGGPVNTEVWEKLKPKLQLLKFITKWKEAEATTDTADRLNDATIRQELSVIALEFDYTVPHDQVYSILGLFPQSVSSAVPIDYNKDARVALAKFCSLAPRWCFY